MPSLGEPHVKLGGWNAGRTSGAPRPEQPAKIAQHAIRHKSPHVGRLRSSADRLLNVKGTSHIVNPQVRPLEKELDPVVKVRGEVFRDPELRTTPDGRTFTRLLLFADSVIENGRETTSGSRWHTGNFWDDQAREAPATMKDGAPITCTDVDDPRYWKSQYRCSDHDQIVACRF